MKTISITFLIMLCPALIHTVSGVETDSTYLKISELPNDTVKVNQLIDYAYSLRRTKSDTALLFAREALALSESIDYKNGKVNAYQTISQSFHYGEQQNKALEFAIKGLKLAQSYGFKIAEGNILDNIGNIHYEIRQYEKALDYFNQSLEIRRTILDEEGVAITLANMGNLTRFHFNDMAQTIKYYDEAAEIFRNMGLEFQSARIWANISDLYSYQQKYDSALILLRRAYPIQQKAGNVRAISFIYNGFADIFLNTGKHDSAVYYSRLSIDVAKELNSLSREQSAHRLLSKIYAANQQYDSAYSHYLISTQLKDSLFNLDTQKQVAEIEMKYKDELKEKELAVLKKENEINEVKIKNTAVERRYWLAMTILLLVGVSLLWSRLRQRKKYTDILEKRKSALEEKSSELKEQYRLLNETMERLKNTQTRLLESEKIASLNVLTAGLAHELNNPLNYVQGVIRPIRVDMDELWDKVHEGDIKKIDFLMEEIDNLLSNLNEGVDKVSSIISNLMDISPNVLNESKRSIEVEKLLEAVVSGVFYQKEEIAYSYEVVKPVSIIAEYAEISQVFVNILRNCVEATAQIENPRIAISLDKVDSKAVVKISDNGPGIAKDQLSKIFEPFYSTKDPGKGTGLGLYICRSIIKKYNGDIEVRSNDGSGSAFIISLPARIDYSEG